MITAPAPHPAAQRPAAQHPAAAQSAAQRPAVPRAVTHVVAPQGRSAAALLTQVEAPATGTRHGMHGIHSAEAGLDHLRCVEQERRDAECLTFFTCLVTAALTVLGLAVFTDVEGMPRMLLTVAVTVFVGVTVHALARPSDED